MSEETFINDPRVACKYGVNCYQKNPDHHRKFKHLQCNGKESVKTLGNSRLQPDSAINCGTKRKPNHKHDSGDEASEKIRKKVKLLDENLTNVSSGDGQTSTSNQEFSTSDTSTLCNAENQLLKCNQDTKAVPGSPQDVPQQVSDSEEEECNFSYYHKHTDPNVLKDLFLVEMPEDFFKFYECLSKECKDVEQLLAKVNLQLIGPYDFLLGKMPKLLNKDKYLIHWRFYYDPPEFLSVLKKTGTSQFHIGYFRDDPNEKPAFLARNDSAKDCIITPIADNIFGAVCWYLKNEKSPFTAVACKMLLEKVQTWAKEHNYSTEEYQMKKRLSQINARTLHSAGIVVPYNKKTQLGYRPLVESYGKIKDMFKRLNDAKTEAAKDKVLGELQPVITYANIAVDECDFGTGLEAGIALFCSGLQQLQKSALACLEMSYSLLRRDAYKKIIQEHLAQRRKGPNMSVF